MAVVCLTVGLPIYIIIAVAVVIDDFGNPFFVQERVGKNGKLFKMVKFRTMYVNADDMKHELEGKNEYESVHFKITDNPRVTKVGKFLCRTSLDETPQALNLLMGSMTIIGPRQIM